MSEPLDCRDPAVAHGPKAERASGVPVSGRAPWLAAAAALFAAYALGVQTGPAVGASAPPQTGGGGTVAPQQPNPAPVFATADSNSRMIAVTGVDLTGQSVLYLIDTVDRQLAVYQASGGGSGTQGVRLVGARKIDLDLSLHGYNDRSEYKYKDLEREFQKLQER